VQEYVDIMNSLNLPNPKMMDVAVPANLHVGLPQDLDERHDLALTCAEAIDLVGRPDIVLVDLRDRPERIRHGEIPGSVHAPYSTLSEHLAPGGLLHELARATDRKIVFYCAYGERSAMAVEVAQEAGIANSCHIKGGIAAWKTAQGPVAGAA
jgi:rhodanese-related sulfurtransferase